MAGLVFFAYTGGSQEGWRTIYLMIYLAFLLRELFADPDRPQ
jgi:hypothetical protein